MKSVLIAYATRYGATRYLAETMSRLFAEAGVAADLHDLRSQGPLGDLSLYDGIIIGSGIKAGRWCKEAEAALATLIDTSLPTALFVSCFEAYKSGEEQAAATYIVPKAAMLDTPPKATVALGPVFDLRPGLKLGFMEKRLYNAMLGRTRKEGIAVPDGEVTPLVSEDDLKRFVEEFLE